MIRGQVVTGVDIGGTKVKVGAIEVIGGRVSDHVVASRQMPTARVRPAPFYDAVAALIRTVWEDVSPLGWSVLPLIGVAHPGRLLADGTLARGTTPNLGAVAEDFDGLHPAQELSARLSARVCASNDAVAQMRYGLERLLRDPALRPCVVGRTVVYLGPGTGMGGGVALVGAQGEVDVATDGQLFDLQVQTYGDGTRIAEELFTGPAVARLIGEANRHLDPPIDPPTPERLGELLSSGPEPLALHVAAARRIAQAQGEVLAAIIRQIHGGRIIKVRLDPQPDGAVVRHVDEPDRAWPSADQAAVRGAERFLFGGSIGASPTLGRLIRMQALEELERHRLENVKIFQLPGVSADAGLLGAASSIPQSLLR